MRGGTGSKNLGLELILEDLKSHQGGTVVPDKREKKGKVPSPVVEKEDRGSLNCLQKKGWLNGEKNATTI